MRIVPTLLRQAFTREATVAGTVWLVIGFIFAPLGGLVWAILKAWLPLVVICVLFLVVGLALIGHASWLQRQTLRGSSPSIPAAVQARSGHARSSAAATVFPGPHSPARGQMANLIEAGRSLAMDVASGSNLRALGKQFEDWKVEGVQFLEGKSDRWAARFADAPKPGPSHITPEPPFKNAELRKMWRDVQWHLASLQETEREWDAQSHDRREIRTTRGQVTRIEWEQRGVTQVVPMGQAMEFDSVLPHGVVQEGAQELSAEWEIHHRWGHHPIVRILDMDGSEVEAEVVQKNADTVVVKFGRPQQGIVIRRQVDAVCEVEIRLEGMSPSTGSRIPEQKEDEASRFGIPTIHVGPRQVEFISESAGPQRHLNTVVVPRAIRFVQPFRGDLIYLEKLPQAVPFPQGRLLLKTTSGTGLLVEELVPKGTVYRFEVYP